MRNGLGTRSFKDHCNKQNYNSYNLQQRQEQCVFLKDLYGLNLKIVVGFFFFYIKRTYFSFDQNWTQYKRVTFLSLKTLS